MSELEVIDVPVDPAWPEGFRRWAARQERRRELLLRRRVPWQLRKHAPGLAIEYQQRLAEMFQQAARRYMAGAPGDR